MMVIEVFYAEVVVVAVVDSKVQYIFGNKHTSA
jgi:hypothetical protein